MRKLSIYILFFATIALLSCTAPSPLTAIGGSQTTAAQVSSKELSTGVAGNYVKKRMKLSLAGHRDAYVLLFLAGDSGSTVTSKPTVLMTLPYEGFDWSEDAVDRKWSTDPAASSGFSANDSDSIAYPGAGVVGYSLKSEADLYGDALFYLLHNMNVAFVFNRYYAGQTFVEHAFDTAMALRYLSKEKFVDADRIGVYGLSWGGMTAAYGAILGQVPVKQLTLLSPAIDVKGLTEYYSTWIPSHVSAPSKLTAYSTFYAPYGRRIEPNMTPAKANDATIKPFLDPNSIASKLTSMVEHTTVMADDSDTLVPTSKTRAIVSAMPSAKVSGLWWTHATAIDYENAALAHQTDAANALVFSDVMTITQMEMAYALLPSSANMTILIYDMNQWNTYLQYMRNEQIRGQDMATFTRMLIQMAGPRVLVMNQQDNTQSGAGNIFVSTWLSVYWGETIAPADVVTTLQTTGLPP